MNFVGTGRRLAQGDVGAAARAIGIETAVLLAFIEVEAAGRGFDSRNRPKMLFEPHVMYRNTSGTVRQRAVSAGVAYAAWRANGYPADSYPRLSTAIGIAREAGFRSGSYGLPQILGENHKAAGFGSAEAMFSVMRQGEREQLMAMVTLLQTWGLAAQLRGKDFSKPVSWADAARKYNGKSYAVHGYHTRLAAAYVKHTRGEAMALPAGSSTMLVRGMKGEAVRNLQADLQTLGFRFALGVDGRFGGETEANVRLFQAGAGLTIDGKAGPATQDAIAKALAAKEVDFSPPAPERPQASQNLLSIILAAIAAFFMRMRKD